ncbi:MAG: AAA family ATPase [Actinobacteria bacterium]|uniref:DNA 3'-5' helicase n=1 Tax=freshwater metagenome TaxID=449393 RepID=A0A6J7EJT7_9ZZZZ|nr:AAA family ATPase [Actinomycetota bacterium]
MPAPNTPNAPDADQLLEHLNPPQRDAVTHDSGPLLILAGAGSGKTRVLTHRLAWLVATGRADATEILAITFTNRAAKEMRHRVEHLINRSTQGLWVMTFHSACARILRIDGEKIGYASGFSIFDQDDSKRLIKRTLDDLGHDPKRVAPAAVQGEISRAKNAMLTPAEYSDSTGSWWEETVAEVYRSYERSLEQQNAMDFDDLLVRTVRLLEGHDEVRQRWNRRFKHVMVDEYQDTNHAQYRLLNLLSQERRNLAVVGDDDQSIYSFRSADIRNILDFEKDHPDAVVVKLEQNYRSTQTILSAANAVISNNQERKSKSLWTESGEGDRIQIIDLEDEHAEARFVAGQIARLEEEGTSRDDIAVFSRTNATSRAMQDRLTREGIPFQVVGGTKFYERAEIRDAVAYLQLIVNPADQAAFSRVVNTPRRGIGPTTVSRVLAWANSSGLPVMEAVADPAAVPGLGTAAVKALDRFVAIMTSLAEVRASNPSTGNLVEEMFAKTGLIEALEAERTIESEGRVENLQELIGVGREHDANEEDNSLEAFLSQVSLVADADERQDDEGLVTLMTLHNAKGLEFPVVFVIACEEGLFPHSRSIEEGNVEEERRLAYVAITRAERELWLTWAHRRMVFGNWMGGLPSRFLHEIPPELVEGAQERVTEAPSWLMDAVSDSASGGAQSGVNFRIGDDVVHEQFGTGVVTSIEPGGVVAVRFGSDGAERRLVAALAPLAPA